MKMIHYSLIAAVGLAVAACGPQEPEVVGGGPADPMAEELAAAEPIDPSMVPQMIGSDDYRCTGTNLLISIDWVQTGDELTARVTPAGEAGVSFTQTEGGGFTTETEGASLSGSPNADSVTFNGVTCNR